jgi:hypothetical protein
VSYPAASNASASVVSVSGTRPLRQTPWVVAYWPVWSDARVGAHTGWELVACSKTVPSAAASSRFGVRSSGDP